MIDGDKCSEAKKKNFVLISFNPTLALKPSESDVSYIYCQPQINENFNFLDFFVTLFFVQKMTFPMLYDQVFSSNK